MKAGSIALTMLAVDGPTSSRPRKKVMIGRIVEMRTSPATDSHAASPKPRSSWPVAIVNAPTEVTAPVTTIAVSVNGSAPGTTVSAVRM